MCICTQFELYLQLPLPLTNGANFLSTLAASAIFDAQRSPEGDLVYCNYFGPVRVRRMFMG
jgi:hypothetical protein